MSMRRAIEMRRTGNPFKGLRNVGPATRADFSVLGIATIEQLASSDPDELYVMLQLKTGSHHDPCVWDVFAAAIHQARTGEARDWWAFTAERKKRQARGEFPDVLAVTQPAACECM